MAKNKRNGNAIFMVTMDNLNEQIANKYLSLAGTVHCMNRALRNGKITDTGCNSALQLAHCNRVFRDIMFTMLGAHARLHSQTGRSAPKTPVNNNIQYSPDSTSDSPSSLQFSPGSSPSYGTQPSFFVTNNKIAISENSNLATMGLKSLNDEENSCISFLSSKNVINTFTVCVSFIDNLITKLPHLKNLASRNEETKHICINMRHPIELYEYCCSRHMAYNEKTTELLCLNCGRVIFMQLDCYNKLDIAGNATQKHLSYDPVRYLGKWLNKMLGCDFKNTISDEDLSTIDKHVEKFYKGAGRMASLDVYSMRKILKNLKMGKYNSYTTFFIARYSNKKPPTLTPCEIGIIKSAFQQIINIYSGISTRIKISYYPFFILKIIESLFYNNPEKKTFMNYIYSQKKQTVMLLDRAWHSICEIAKQRDHSTFLRYTPTKIWSY